MEPSKAKSIRAAARQICDLIVSQPQVVFFGGAGVSTESGIPDFRSEDGLFRAQTQYGRRPEELLTESFMVSNPALQWRYIKENLVHREARPNAAHRALAAFEARGLVTAVVTQNIDGLHQAAGSNNVFELHGSLQRFYCRACGKKFSLDYALNADSDRPNHEPECSACRGSIRPDVVLYGEQLGAAVLQAAISAIKKADVLIVAGTSLEVYPAAGLVDYFQGQALVLINITPTALDSRADLVVHAPVGKVFSQVRTMVMSKLAQSDPT
jgi:NAD-dependent deacetylase